jgi:hypothetical protein
MSKKMKFSKEDVLTADDLDISSAKIRITTMVDKVVYDALKREAKANGGKYQTFLNKILADHFSRKGSPKGSLEERLSRMEKLIEGQTKNRIAAKKTRKVFTTKKKAS